MKLVKEQKDEVDKYQGLDVEWIYLLLEAKKSGVSIEELRKLLFALS